LRHVIVGIAAWRLAIECPTHMNIEIVARLLGWAALCAIVALTCVPPSWRLVTGASHTAEHFAIFFLAGGFFAVGYQRNPIVIGALAVAVIGALELIQLFAPGRHARVIDFVVNALGASFGIAAAWLFLRACQAYGAEKAPPPKRG
jgi:VanZ family protein